MLQADLRGGHSRLQHAVESSSLPELPPVITTVLPVRSCPATTCSAVTLLGRSSFSMPYIIWVMLRKVERSNRSHRLNLNSVTRLPPGQEPRKQVTVDSRVALNRPAADTQVLQNVCNYVRCYNCIQVQFRSCRRIPPACELTRATASSVILAEAQSQLHLM